MIVRGSVSRRLSATHPSPAAVPRTLRRRCQHLFEHHLQKSLLARRALLRRHFPLLRSPTSGKPSSHLHRVLLRRLVRAVLLLLDLKQRHSHNVSLLYVLELGKWRLIQLSPPTPTQKPLMPRAVTSRSCLAFAGNPISHTSRLQARTRAYPIWPRHHRS